MASQTAVAVPVAIQSIGIPVILLSAAAFQITHRINDMAAAFFSYNLIEQVSVLTILFSVIFAAVSTSHNGDMIFGSRASSPSIPYPLQAIQAAETDKDKFLTLYPLLKQQMLSQLSSIDEMPSEATQWCAEMMDYNVPGGKLNRGTMVPTVLAAIHSKPLSPLQHARAAVLGWAIEFLQAFFLVADDVMDESVTRRGQPCWYRLPKVKMIAINDSFLLESFVFGILRLHFGNEPYYGDLVALLLDVVQKTEIGQLLDLTSQPMDAVTPEEASSTSGPVIDLDRFTLQRYRLIVQYKTAYYSFYLPVAMGMIMAGIKDKRAFDLANKICLLMGEYFQVQDDYLDCYGDPEVIGKVGTDIQDNKCSWLVVQALQRATPDQKQILRDNYGRWDDQCVARVKQLYKELELEKLFQEYEEQSYAEIQKHLSTVKLVPRQVFDLFLQKIYKRSK